MGIDLSDGNVDPCADEGGLNPAEDFLNHLQISLGTEILAWQKAVLIDQMLKQEHKVLTSGY